MDRLISAPKVGVLYFFIVNFLPGVLVTTTFLFFLNSVHNFTSTNICRNEYYFYFVVLLFFFLSCIVGMIIENIGSHIERLYDLYYKKLGIDKTWNEFLKHPISDNKTTIAHKYLQSILLRYKFELSMLPSLIIIQLIYYFGLMGKYDLHCSVVILVPTFTLFLVFQEIPSGCKLLHKIRKTIVNK